MRALLLSLLVLAFGLSISPVSRAQGVSAGAGLAQPQVAVFGDSITAGNQDGSGITWPNQLLAQRPTYQVYNNGIGGQGSGQIAVRMNAYVGKTQQTVDQSFTYPNSGASVQVHFPAFYDGCYRAFTPGILISFTLSGVTYSGYCIDPGTHLYSFVPISWPGSPIVVASGTNWTAANGTQASGCMIIEEGRNNFATDTQVKADIAASVAAAQRTTNCWALMTILNGDTPSEWSGQSDYLLIKALNDWMAATYPGHVIDIRAALVAAYNPANPADVIDQSHDVPPYSLRSGDLSGTLGTIADTTTCAFTSSTALNPGEIITVGSEKVFITSGSSGAYVCTRGYASTVAATHTNGAAYAGVDALHPGQNATSAANPNYNNGYKSITATTKTWLDANGL